jgi:hypothetical protein
MNRVERGRLQQLCNAAALCRYLKRQIGPGRVPCDHTYHFTRQYLRTLEPRTNQEEVLMLLRGAGMRCDCQVQRHLCADPGL